MQSFARLPSLQRLDLSAFGASNDVFLRAFTILDQPRGSLLSWGKEPLALMRQMCASSARPQVHKSLIWKEAVRETIPLPSRHFFVLRQSDDDG